MSKSNIEQGDDTNPQAPLVLTMGDPAGIGPEITLKAWAARNRLKLPRFCVIADPGCIEIFTRLNGIEAQIEQVSSVAESAQIFDHALPVIPVVCSEIPTPGAPTSANAAVVVKSIEMAVSLVMDGQASGLVTNPISKAHLYEAGFSHPGHTEFLAELAKTRNGKTMRPVMMLASAELRVVPLTIHIPLKDVAKSITQELILDIVKITSHGLRQDFGIANPKIALAGLNPHAGEMGAMGMEETEIIRPAIEALLRDGYSVSGPHPADTMFHEKAREAYDAVVAMYHDQALIPIKTLAFDRGVNTTLGLPFVRTSPDHGTAFDIAGKNVASETSLCEALKLAQKMADNRARFHQQKAAH